MTKTELIAHIAETCNVTKKSASEMVDSFVEAVVNGVKKEGEVRIQGFGVFKLSERKGREGINPRTREKIQIKAMKLPVFKAGADFKKAVK